MTATAPHVMGRVILGAASVRFDPDALYYRMLQGPLEEGLRDHGRGWFNREFFYAHRYLAAQIMVIEEMRADIEEYEWASTDFGGRKVSAESMKKVLRASLDIAVEFATTEPILDKHKIAKATDLHRMTVIRAIKGLIVLGWLEVVPEPEKKFDDPWIYRLLPAESRLNPRISGGPPPVVHLDPSLEEEPLVAGSLALEGSKGSTHNTPIRQWE